MAITPILMFGLAALLVRLAAGPVARWIAAGVLAPIWLFLVWGFSPDPVPGWVHGGAIVAFVVMTYGRGAALEEQGEEA